VYGYGVVDKSPYLAMEMLVGGTLEGKLEGGEPLDPGFVFFIGKQMLEALAFAHSRAVVHRDLKPDNIFIVEKPGSMPQVKLLDYGLAKFLAPEEDPVNKALTMNGMVMGTPLYMAPEQAMGGKVDLTADVYAAGCVLFELFTGRLPFLGETHGELLRAHMMTPVPQVNEASGNKIQAKPELQAFLERAMGKRAEQRFRDAGEMLQAFVAIPQPVASRVGASRAPQPVTVTRGAPDAGDVVVAPVAAKSTAVGVALISGAVVFAIVIVAALLLR
jgi:eukaryotic-like serine/threonine-protein kinase